MDVHTLIMNINNGVLISKESTPLMCDLVGTTTYARMRKFE